MDTSSIHAYHHYVDSPLQWFGDMTKAWAENNGLSPADADGIALFVTDETVLLLMQEWADSHLASDNPTLLDRRTLSDALWPDPDITTTTTKHQNQNQNENHHPLSVQLVLDYHDELTAHRSRGLTWDFVSIGCDEVRLRAEEVLLSAMRLYWLTYASWDPRVVALCPTTDARALRAWPGYDPCATYGFLDQWVRQGLGKGGCVVMDALAGFGDLQGLDVGVGL